MIILQNIIDSKYHYQPSWVMLIIVLGIMILGYLYSAFNSRFHAFLKAVFVYRFVSQSSREDHSLSHPVSLFLSLNFILTASLFILQLISSNLFFHLEIDFSLASFFIIALGILSVYFTKLLFLKIFGYIINKQEIISQYEGVIFLINQFLGIMLIPIITFIAYGPESFTNTCIYAGTALVIISFILRIGKGISSATGNKGFTLFYLISYLCTVEILPLLFGIKLFEKLVR